MVFASLLNQFPSIGLTSSVHSMLLLRIDFVCMASCSFPSFFFFQKTNPKASLRASGFYNSAAFCSLTDLYKQNALVLFYCDASLFFSETFSIAAEKHRARALVQDCTCRRRESKRSTMPEPAFIFAP